nr:hypothetical protein [uncultured Duganella sp.]
MSPIYQVQARRKGRTDDAAWFDMEEIRPLPSDQAARCVNALNGSVPDFVYRAVLVAGGVDESALPVNAMESTEMPLTYQIQGRRRGLSERRRANQVNCDARTHDESICSTSKGCAFLSM